MERPDSSSIIHMRNDMTKNTNRYRRRRVVNVYHAISSSLQRRRARRARIRSLTSMIRLELADKDSHNDVWDGQRRRRDYNVRMGTLLRYLTRCRAIAGRTPPPPIYFPQHKKENNCIHNKTIAEGYQRSHMRLNELVAYIISKCYKSLVMPL